MGPRLLTCPACIGSGKCFSFFKWKTRPRRATQLKRGRLNCSPSSDAVVAGPVSLYVCSVSQKELQSTNPFKLILCRNEEVIAH